MCVAVTALSVLGILVLAVVMMPQMAGYFWRDFGNYAFINGELLRYDPEVVAAYKQYRDYMDRDVIYPGIFVDGVHVGDLTVEEARQLLTANGSDVPNAFSVTVAIGNKTWTVDSSNVPAQRTWETCWSALRYRPHQHHVHSEHAADALPRAHQPRRSPAGKRD